jgi:UDP-N-acetyl-D-glucosamine dehydrogenase
MSEAFDLSGWKARMDAREIHVGIIGLGYVGLPLALLFSEARIRVTGFDIDAAKVDALNEGRSYIQRIAPEEIAAARANGFHATTDIAALRACDAVLICVPTPLAQDRTPDMSFITNTVEALAPHTRAGQLIVLESTTWPGTTTELVVPTLERLGTVRVHRGEGVDGLLLVAFSPEREDPGNTTTPRRAIPKVIGGVSVAASEAAAALYGTIFDRTVVVSSTEAAEMTKLLENIYRGVNIALVNELKQLCIAMGIDIWEVIDAAKTKPFGFQAFYPGPGIGGHCIPVDPFYLSWRAKQFDQPTRFIELAGQVNQAMPEFVLRTVERALEREGKALRGARVLLLGIAYKRDVDDLRESPALTLFGLLQDAGAAVAYNDPYFAEVGGGRHYAIHQRSTPLEDVVKFDCVVLVTDHSAYDVAALVEASKLFVDTRNATRGLVSEKIVRC